MKRRTPLYALYAADVISLAGNAVSQLAIPWFVLTTTGSAALTALAVFFNFLPIVFATFFGGVVVDRLGFRTSSVVADLASAAAVAAIPLLHSTIGLELWELMALVFLGALLDAPGATARAALIPDLVELAGVRLERASGIRGAIQQGGTLVGAPIGGVLVATVGATNALWLDSVTFLFSAALVAFLVPRPKPAAKPEQPTPFLTELADGLRFVWRQRLLRAMVLTVLLTNLIEAPFPVVMAVFAREEYGSAADLGVMYGTLGGAALAGALAYSAWGHRWPRRLTFILCFATLPIMYLLLATLPPLPVAVVGLAVVGLASGPLNPLIFTVVAEMVPVELRGRVFGAVRGGAWAAIPLGILLGGVVVAAVGPAATFLAIGLSYAGVIAYAFLNPAFRALDASASASGEGGDEAATAET
jgi:MFS family permease